MIQGFSAAYIIPYSSGGPAAARKVSVPVRPILASTMMFKHVIGVPVRPPAESLPAFKLQLLDRLLDRLARMGGDSGRIRRQDPVDVRLAAVGSALRRLSAARAPFAPGLMPEAGTIVNRLA